MATYSSIEEMVADWPPLTTEQIAVIRSVVVAAAARSTDSDVA